MKEIIKITEQFGKEFHDQVIDFTRLLIQTPSISGKEKGVASLLLQKMEELCYDECFIDDMGNVVGIVKGTESGPSIMFNGHMDHVSPGDLKNWGEYNPYGGQVDIVEIDDQDKKMKEMVECIHGRGASDVKAGLAALVYAGGILIKLREQGFKFKGQYIFTGVVQEEPAEMVGITHLIDKTFPERGLRYDAMVTCEATSLKLYCGHRGRVEMMVTVYGRNSHSSAPWFGINAIYKAMPLIEKIKDDLYETLPVDEKLGKATISLNIIECLPGALSIVPDRCTLSLDRRTVPGESPEKALAEIQGIIDELTKKDPEFKATVEIKPALEVSYTGLKSVAFKQVNPWKIAEEHPFVAAAAKGLKEVGQPIKYGYWDFATDASKTAGLDKKPCIGYSPMQEQFAHTPNDKVRIDFIDKALIGYVSVFLSVTELNEEAFKPLQ